MSLSFTGKDLDNKDHPLHEWLDRGYYDGYNEAFDSEMIDKLPTEEELTERETYKAMLAPEQLAAYEFAYEKGLYNGMMDV